KLHQFISGAGHAFATLEPPGQRSVTVEGQQFYPGAPDKRLYSTHFCRRCGQEYHPVRLVTQDGLRTVLARNIDDALLTDDNETDGSEGSDKEEIGFLTIRTPDLDAEFTDAIDQYPEMWREADAAGNARLKREYRAARARAVRVEPDGRLGSGT